MRLHRLELTAIGPFATSQVVDFDRLCASGLFLLEGPTGAGKTTVLDAITFALYGPGERGGDGRLHSDFAAREVTPEVRLEFSVHGVRHRITRTPEYERPKRRGTGTTRQQAQAHLERWEGDAWVSRSANKAEVADMLADELGLNRDQFTQVVLLPQGEFARFLRSNDDERRAVLTKLFGTQLYDRITAEIEVQGQAAARDLDAASARVRSCLAAAAEAASMDADARDELLALAGAERRKVLLQCETRLLARRDEARVTERGARAACEGAAAAAERAAASAERLARYAAARAAVDEHEDGRAEVQRAERVLEAARRAEPVRPLLRGADEAARALEVVNEQLRRLLGEDHGVAELGRAALLEKAAAAREAAGALAPIVQREETFAAAQAEVDRRAAELADSAREAQRAEVELSRRVARCRRAADDAAREVLAATHAHQRSVDDHQTLVDARLAGIAAELAGGLVDGRPCPVCGSHEHPRPATAGQRVSPSDVTAAAQRRAKAEHARRCAEQAAETAVRAVALAEAELTAAKERAAAVHVHSERAVKEARDRLAALTEELDVARAGFASIRERHAHLLGQAKRLARLAEAVGTAAEAQRRLDAALSSAEHEAVAAGFTDRAEARGAIRTSGECAELSARIAAWHDEAHRRAGLLAAAAATCVGDERDGVAPGARADAARSAAAAASREAKARAQELENAAAAARAAEAAVARFTERRRDLLAAEAELDAVRADAEPVLYLSKLTRGMAGQRRVALTTYVLRYWFEQVVQAANVRLSAISSGRYELLRVDEGQARNERSGLTVAVLDRHTGEARSARSLSGGETFYTSLALALGLADVVRAQAGGIDLDSLFIDEGFGSLDADTLDEVLAVIEDLRERGRVVGIVSHLTELKELIPERVEVRRRDDGSSELRVVA